MAQVAKPQAAKTNNGNFQDKEKPMEVRMSNITAAKGKLNKNFKLLRVIRLIILFSISRW